MIPSLHMLDSELAVLTEEGDLGVTEVSSLRRSDQFSTVKNAGSILEAIKNKLRMTLFFFFPLDTAVLLCYPFLPFISE